MSAESSRDRAARLHVLVDDHPRWKHDPVTQAELACAGGASVIQLRAKLATDRESLAWARAIRKVTSSCGVEFFVNDRFDLAWLAEADGVHLGQEDPPPEALPEAVRRRLRIGRSTHTLDEARAASGEDVAYVAFGPIFATTSKESPYEARGVEALREVVGIVKPLPVVAIGGIREENVAEILRAGARGIAVISAIAGAEDPKAATRALVSRLAEGAACE